MASPRGDLDVTSDSPLAGIRPGRLLLVEDDASLREILARFLEECGVEVICAGSLAEGRAELEEGHFDAYVLDVGLPDGSGLALLEIAPPERVLIISACDGTGATQISAHALPCGIRRRLRSLFGTSWQRDGILFRPIQ